MRRKLNDAVAFLTWFAENLQAYKGYSMHGEDTVPLYSIVSQTTMVNHIKTLKSNELTCDR